MKKLMSFLLVIVLVFVFVPMPVSATQEQKLSGQEELIALACEAFPEYENRILSRRGAEGNSRSINSNRTLVVSETRNISDNELVVYSEYSDGLILLSYAQYRYSTTTNSMEQEGSRTLWNVTVRATSVDVTNAYFELRNVQFTVYPSSYDRITNVGTYAEYGRCDMHTRYTPVLNESASGRANIVYRLSWELYESPPGGWIGSVLRFEVGNNGFYVIHQDYDQYVINYGYPS